MFFNDWADGYVIRDDHVVKLDVNGIVIDDRTASGVSLIGKRY